MRDAETGLRDELDRAIGEVNVNESVLASSGIEARPLVESDENIVAECVVICHGVNDFNTQSYKILWRVHSSNNKKAVYKKKRDYPTKW